MKCDDFLTVISSGGAVARFRARIHAAHCEACTAELVRFESLRDALSRTSEVTETHRALWARAAGQAASELDSVVVPFQRAQLRRWSLAAASLLIIVSGAAFIVFAARTPAPNVALTEFEPRPPAQMEQPRDFPERQQLERSLDELSQELKQLDREAELLDARRDLERLSLMYPALGPTNASQAIAN
jgi:hypothetical protein